ncbi:AFF3 isoform 14 [Sesbania bispinosa]|nr:AFF3 isoform 14 [Sesbania bispinosa]
MPAVASESTNKLVMDTNVPKKVTTNKPYLNVPAKQPLPAKLLIELAEATIERKGKDSRIGTIFGCD